MQERRDSRRRVLSLPAPNLGQAVTGWVPWEADAEMEFSRRMFMKEHPWDPHLWKRRDGSRVWQRGSHAPMQAQDSLRELWS